MPQPIITSNLVTDSTESPHSDKLILCHVTVVIGTIIAEYGLSLASTARKDLASTLGAFLIEVIALAKDGAELMIESGWLERVPGTANRKKLMS